MDRIIWKQHTKHKHDRTSCGTPGCRVCHPRKDGNGKGRFTPKEEAQRDNMVFLLRQLGFDAVKIENN